MWHDIFQSYADAISVATMQRPSVDRPRPVDEAALLRSELRRDRASPTGIAGRIGQRLVAWVRQSRHPAVAGCG